jgi:hypothetical protein
MSGRILPVALATVVGVSIGVATFDGEFKEQRRKRIEEEYNRYASVWNSFVFASLTSASEVAAQAALTSEGAKPMASNAIPPPPPQQVPAPLEANKDETEASSSWSSLLGMWAWKKDAAKGAPPAAQKPAHEQTEQKSKP